MPGLTRDQIRHEVINLQKTLNLLDRSFKEEDWTRCTSKERNDKWLKSQSIIAGIRHCRAVLQKVSPVDYDLGLGDRRSVSGEQFHENTKRLLDHFEQEILEISQDLSPRPRLPKPILPTLPRPSVPAQKADSSQAEKLSEQPADKTLIPVSESELGEKITIPPPEVLVEPPESSKQTENTLPNLRTNPTNPAAVLNPPSLPASSSQDRTVTGSIRGPLATSTSLHEELTNQLAQMSAQLRRNAEHFNEALAKDEGILKATQEKLERNYDDVTKERVRLRDHSAKSRGTTWLVFISIVVVVVAFLLTFFLIRVT